MKQWLKDAVFYEIYPQSFYDTNGDGIGDFPGIIAKLDYIKDLGCNALWINPCYDSPFKDAGYDVRDYKKIAPRYGTNADAAALFKAADEGHAVAGGKAGIGPDEAVGVFVVLGPAAGLEPGVFLAGVAGH